jgi:colicin import membrane protein
VNPAAEAPREAYFGPSALLALAMHVLFVLALVLGVHWQSRAPDAVTVELWQPPRVEPAPPPRVEPAPPPKPVPEVKPEPRIEKPDIAVKAAPKPKPKPKPKPVPPPPKPKPVAKPKPDETLAKQLLAEALQREEQSQAAERERQAIKQQLQREATAARARAMQTWVDRISAKIRGNIVMPPGIRGNPEALVLVSQLPTGEVLDAKLVISSGYAAYDAAVLRATLKSSPLPKPDTPDLFERDLKLTFHPQD